MGAGHEVEQGPLARAGAGRGPTQEGRCLLSCQTVPRFAEHQMVLELARWWESIPSPPHKGQGRPLSSRKPACQKSEPKGVLTLFPWISGLLVKEALGEPFSGLPRPARCRAGPPKKAAAAVEKTIQDFSGTSDPPPGPQLRGMGGGGWGVLVSWLPHLPLEALGGP